MSKPFSRLVGRIVGASVAWAEARIWAMSALHEPNDEDNGPCGSAMGSGDFQRALRYSYRVRWSEEDQEFVATCEEFPSLSWLEADQIYALHKLVVLVRDVLRDMRVTGETPPRPGERSA